MRSYKSYLSVHRRSILSFGLAAENREDIEKSEKFKEKSSNLIQQTREEYGRYFGICGLYHHLKACVCKNCPSYSGGAGMFCSRSKSSGDGKKQGCLCEICELFRKYRLEGEYFCLKAKKPEFTQPVFIQKSYRKPSGCSGKTRFCIVEELNVNR